MEKYYSITEGYKLKILLITVNFLKAVFVRCIVSKLMLFYVYYTYAVTTVYPSIMYDDVSQSSEHYIYASHGPSDIHISVIVLLNVHRKSSLRFLSWLPVPASATTAGRNHRLLCERCTADVLSPNNLSTLIHPQKVIKEVALKK